jgi:hypothetical protein
MAREARDNESSRGSFFDSSQQWEEQEEGCLLCEKNITHKEFPNIISKALERKYCNNLNNYFYLKDINKIVNKERYTDVTQVQGAYTVQGVASDGLPTRDDQAKVRKGGVQNEAKAAVEVLRPHNPQAEDCHQRIRQSPEKIFQIQE